MNVKEIFSKPVTRAELCLILGVSDREARKMIAELQENYNIVNLQNGKGYFLADDETTKRYAEQEMRRALKSFNKAREMLKRVTDSSGIKIPVKAHFRTIKGIEDDANQIKFI